MVVIVVFMKLLENLIDFSVYDKDGHISKKSIKVKKLCFGRHCSRDIDITRKSLDLKRSEGYAVYENPNICIKSSYLLTNESEIEVQGLHTSGEVEFVAIMYEDDIVISVGSDHNDRSLEMMWTGTLGKIYDSAKSKQMVPAVIANEAWKYEDIKDHWDELILSSYITLLGEKRVCQNFSLSDLVNLEYHFKTNPWLREEGIVFFGGSKSLSTEHYPTNFHFEVFDPILNRKISHSYIIRCLNEKK
jgi:hypothetical protein